MKTLLITIMSVFLFAFSCKDDAQTEQLNGLEGEVAEALSDAGIKAEDFKGNINELLTLEMASKVSELPAEAAKTKHTNFSSLESLKYVWGSNRIRKVEFMPGKFIDAPLENVIELSWVKNTTLKQFKHDYHNPTPEEIKNAEAAMEKKMTELEAEGKATENQTNTASGIAKSSISKFKVTEVPNLGDYSVLVDSGIMGATTRDLKVFYRGLSFTLRVDLSDDMADNDQKAITAARMIIDEKLK